MATAAWANIGAASERARAIVTLGDSLTDGFASTPDTNQRWPNLLAERLVGLLPGLRVLFMSGYTGSALDDLNWRDSRAAFLQKPFSPEALAHKLREVLDA